eukprot:6181906-Pleurochrysis_carterae.AAC.2
MLRLFHALHACECPRVRLWSWLALESDGMQFTVAARLNCIHDIRLRMTNTYVYKHAALHNWTSKAVQVRLSILSRNGSSIADFVKFEVERR